FAIHSYWAQVVAELFACVMWWATIWWDERPSTSAAAIFALAGAATFITWPIWIGPPVIALFVVVLMRDGLSLRDRIAGWPLAFLPLAIVIAIQLLGRLQWLGMAGTSGAVIRPTAAALGRIFIGLSAIGLLLMIRVRSARSTLLLLAATAVQAIALAA